MSITQRIAQRILLFIACGSLFPGFLHATSFETNWEAYQYKNEWKLSSSGGVCMFSTPSSFKVGIKQGSTVKREVQIKQSVSGRSKLAEVSLTDSSDRSNNSTFTYAHDGVGSGNASYWIATDQHYLILGHGTKVQIDNVIYISRMSDWGSGSSFDIGLSSMKVGSWAPTAFFYNISFSAMPTEPFWRKEGSVAIHNKRRNNRLHQGTLSAPGSCYLRFNMYDSERSAVVFKDASGRKVYDILIGWGQGIRLGGRIEENERYKRSAHRTVERFWIDYHGNTLTIGTLESDGTPVVQLVVNDSKGAQKISAFEIQESSENKITQCLLLENSTFMPKVLSAAVNTALKAQGKNALNPFHHLPISSDIAHSWAMTFESDQKAECAAFVYAGAIPVHGLKIGENNFTSSSLTSYVPPAYTGTKYSLTRDNRNWGISESSGSSVVSRVTNGTAPRTRYIDAPATSGSFNSYWIMYHHNLVSFGHGTTVGKNVGFVAQATVQNTLTPTQLRLFLSAGALRNVRLQQPPPTAHSEIITAEKNFIAGDGGSTKEALNILEKHGPHLAYHIGSDNRLKKPIHLPLSETARSQQRVAFTFKATQAPIIGFSEKETFAQAYEYWAEITADIIPGKMVSNFRNSDYSLARAPLHVYDYNGNAKSWVKTPATGKEGSTETIHLRFVEESDTPFKHTFFKPNQDLWVVFDKGWFAYGHGSDIGKNCGMIWYFKPHALRRPINFLTLMGYSVESVYYDLKFAELDNEQWKAARSAIEKHFAIQLPESDSTAATIMESVANSKSDALSISGAAPATERKDIMLPTGSAQSWLCTFDATHESSSKRNANILFDLVTKSNTADVAAQSAYRLQLTTGWTQFTSELGNKASRSTHQSFHLPRGKNSNPFDVWIPGGAKTDTRNLQIWVSGADEGKYGLNNDNGRIHADKEKSRRWICYHNGLLATGLGDGPAANGSNVGLVWRMPPHKDSSGRVLPVEKLSVWRPAGQPLMLTGVAMRTLETGEATIVTEKLNTMISGKRDGRNRAGITKPYAELVNHMREQARITKANGSIDTETFDLSDETIMLANPIRTKLTTALTDEQIASQAFVATFTANTTRTLQLRLLNGTSTTLSWFKIGDWLDGNKKTAGINALIYQQEHGKKYRQADPSSDFTVDSSHTNKSVTALHVLGRPLEKDGQPNPALTNRFAAQKYWFYYDGKHLAFGHGDGPSSGKVGFAWRLLEAFGMPVHAFQLDAGDNLLVTPPVTIRAATAEDTSAINDNITNKGLADFKLGVGKTVTPTKEAGAIDPATVASDAEFFIPANAQMTKGIHYFSLSDATKTKQRVAFSFKKRNGSQIIPMLMSKPMSGSHKYTFDLTNNGSDNPGYIRRAAKIVAFKSDKDNNTVAGELRTYNYNTAGRKEWQEGDRLENHPQAGEQVQLTKVYADDPIYRGSELPRDETTVWVVFDNGWAAYGHGSTIGEGTRFVWKFDDSYTNSRFSILGFSGWSTPCTMYKLKVYGDDEVDWEALDVALHKKMVSQLSGKGAIAQRVLSLVGAAPTEAATPVTKPAETTAPKTETPTSTPTTETKPTETEGSPPKAEATPTETPAEETPATEVTEEAKETWLDLDVQKESFLLRFNATATDAINMVFATAEDEESVYTIQLGKNKAAGSHIFKGSKTPHITFANTGIFNNTMPINYWLAYNKGHFALGQGFQPGQSGLIDWRDDSPAAFSRFKLMGNETTVFTEPTIEDISATLRTQLDSQYVAIGNNGTFNQWLTRWSFPSTGHGTILFNARTAGGLHIGFATDTPVARGSQRPLYELVVDSSDGRESYLKKDGSLLGDILSTEAILPRDTASHPYWCTYDSDAQILTFGSGTEPGTNELLRKELSDADSAIRYFSLTNSTAGVVYANIRSKAVKQTDVSSYIARSNGSAPTGNAKEDLAPGNGLASEWKNEWHFTSAIGFDVKAQNGVVICLNNTLETGSDVYRLRLTPEFNADIVDNADDRSSAVAEDSVNSFLPNDGKYHSFWVRRRGGGTQPAIITLGTWKKGTEKTNHEIGDQVLLEWEDTRDKKDTQSQRPTSYFSFGVYNNEEQPYRTAAFIKNIRTINVKRVITQSTRTGAMNRNRNVSSDTTAVETPAAVAAPAATIPQAPATSAQDLTARTRPSRDIARR